MYGSHGSSLCKHLLHLRFLLAASEQTSRECDDQVVNLKKDRDILKTQIDNLRVREKSNLVEQTQHEIDIARGTFDAICLKKESLTDHLERLRQEIRKEHEARVQEQQELQKLQEKIDQSRRDQLAEHFREEETQKEIESLQQEVLALRTENRIRETRMSYEEDKCLQSQLSTTREERRKSKLSRSFDRQREAFLKAEEIFTKTRKSHMKTEEKNQELKSQIDKRRKESNLLKNEIGSLRKATSQIQARVHHANVRIADEKDRIACLESKLRSTRGGMEIAVEEFESLKKQTEHSQRKLDALMESVKRIRTLLHKTEDGSFYHVQKQMFSLQEDLNNSKAAVSHRMTVAKTECSEDLFQMQQLTTEIANLRFNVESLHRDLLSVQAKNAIISKRKSHMKEKVETRERILAEKKTCLKDFQLLVEDRKQVVRSLDNEIRHLQGTLYSNTRKLVVLQQKNEKLRSTVERNTESLPFPGTQTSENHAESATTYFPMIERKITDVKMGNHQESKISNSKGKNDSICQKLRETRMLLHTHTKQENILHARIRNQRQDNHTLTVILKKATTGQGELRKGAKCESQIREASDVIETAVWNTYQEYKKELKLTERTG